MESDNVKLNKIYSTLTLMNENDIINFLIKIDNIDLNSVQDKVVFLKYIQMIGNYLKICEELNLADHLKKDLKTLKIKLISHLNERSELEHKSI